MSELDDIRARLDRLEAMHPERPRSRGASPEVKAQIHAELLALELSLPPEVCASWRACTRNVIAEHPNTSDSALLNLLRNLVKRFKPLRIKSIVYGLNACAMREVNNTNAVYSYAGQAAEGFKPDGEEYYSGQKLCDYLNPPPPSRCGKDGPGSIDFGLSDEERADIERERQLAKIREME
jgi:hypothetical protein